MDYLYYIISYIRQRWTNYFGLPNQQNLEDFYQLLRSRDYDEAMKLALQNRNLDIDLVYQCKWRNSGITVQSINTVLSKIQDKLWAINECVKTVPISYEACRTLIDFGLRVANLKLLYQLGYEDTVSNNKSTINSGRITKSYNLLNNLTAKIYNKSGDYNELKLLPDDVTDSEILGLIDFENLNDQQKELCRCRQILLRHEHSLFAYENILGDYRTIQQHFDHVFYDELRQKSPFNACIDFAHEGDGHAVEILLNFFTDDLKPHLLAILSHFPETLSPYQYRNLLPCLRGEDDPAFEWRATGGQFDIKRDEFDWCDYDKIDPSYSKYLRDLNVEYEKSFYEDSENLHLKKYLNSFTSDLLSRWYVERALEMESKTLLLSNAIQLLHLGTELNIKNLTRIHADLIEFDKVIYDCCTENNIYLSYTEFTKMNEIDRLLLMTGDSTKNCKERFRFYVIPYIHRRDEILKFQGKVKLLKDYFVKLARCKEHLCQMIYNDLLDKIECDSFVADWTKDLDDALDEIGDEIKKIERDRQAKQLSNLASQTIALGDYNGCYEACQLIMKKNFQECWTVCCQLGMHIDFKNFEAKYKLLAFVLAYCDDPDGKMSAKILDYIIELRKRDERLQLAYLQQNS